MNFPSRKKDPSINNKPGGSYVAGLCVNQKQTSEVLQLLVYMGLLYGQP